MRCTEAIETLPWHIICAVKKMKVPPLSAERLELQEIEVLQTAKRSSLKRHSQKRCF
jgi:hypothetical protein